MFLSKKDLSPELISQLLGATEGKTDLRRLSDDKAVSDVKQNRDQLWKVEVWSWKFDGNFEKAPSSVQIKLSTAEEDQEVEIDSLNYFPIRYDKNETEEKLKSRGRMFWKCRKRFFAMYQEPGYGSFSNVSFFHTLTRQL